MGNKLNPFGVVLLFVIPATVGRCNEEATTACSTETTAAASEDAESSPTQAATTHVAGDGRETMVVHLHHVPAVDTAEAVRSWLAMEDAEADQAAPRIVAVPITNDLIVSTSPQRLATIQGVIDQLDRPSRSIRVKAMVLELQSTDETDSADTPLTSDISNQDFREIVADLKERGEVRVLAQPQLVCADNQPALLRREQRIPRVKSAAKTSRGLATQVELENVGTMLGVTARASESDTVALEIDLECSQLGSDEEGVPLATGEDDEVVRSRPHKTLSLQTTVSLNSGQTALVGGLIYRTEEHTTQLWLLLRPVFLDEEND